jgi:hypothetical protein
VADVLTGSFNRRYGTGYTPGITDPDIPYGMEGEGWPEGWGLPYDTRHGIHAEFSGTEASASAGDAPGDIPYHKTTYGSSGLRDVPGAPVPSGPGPVDRTPVSPAAPFPGPATDHSWLGVSGELADHQAETAGMHGQDLGGPASHGSPGTEADIGRVSLEGLADSPNTSVQAILPGQVAMNGGSGKDTGTNARNNGGLFGRKILFGLDAMIPWPKIGRAERPFYGKELNTSPVFTIDSEYGPVGGDTSGNYRNQDNRNFPSPYQQPPEPQTREVQPVFYASSVSGDAAGSWMAG